MMGNFCGGEHGFLGGLGFFFMLLFGALVLWGIIAIIQSVSKNGGLASQARPADAAMQTLRERYAKGELSQAEFDQMKRDLAG